MMTDVCVEAPQHEQLWIMVLKTRSPMLLRQKNRESEKYSLTSK
jgi:hypothetical protein